MKMKQRLLLVCIILCHSACSFFDTEKISSETIYEEEVQTIDWAEVDAYPLFENCKEDVEKIQQRNCFIQTINDHIQNSILNRNFIASKEISDTLWIVFEINEKGKFNVSKVEMDSLLIQEFPQLKNLIIKNIDSLPHAEPAYKRGIPVKTRFTLPVAIRSN